MKTLHRFSEAVLPAVLVRGVGYLLGLYAIVWGAVVLAPWPAFPTSPLYAGYERWAPEPVWGFAFTLCGALQSLGIRLDRVSWAWVGGVLLTGLYLFAATLFALTDAKNPAAYLYVLFGVLQFIVAAASGGRRSRGRQP